MKCPHCHRSIGSMSKSGEHRVRLSIILVDPATHRVHGPCAKCGEDVTIAEHGSLNKALQTESRRPRVGLRL